MTQKLKILPLLVLLLCGLGGCQPRDPLEWKVDSATPRDFDDWIDRTSSHLPADLRREFNRAILFLRGDSGLAAKPRSIDEPNNQLCLRIDGKTVRQVVLYGYHVEKMFLLNNLSLEAGHILGDLKTAGVFERDQEKQRGLAAKRARQDQTIEAMKTHLAEIEARVAELTPPSP